MLERGLQNQVISFFILSEKNSRVIYDLGCNWTESVGLVLLWGQIVTRDIRPLKFLLIKSSNDLNLVEMTLIDFRSI